MTRSTIALRCAASIALLAGLVAAAPGPADDDPSKLPIVDVADADAIAAHMDQDVILVGVVKAAEWSDSAKVLLITFEKAEQVGTTVATFAKSRAKIDEAFNGDVAKTVLGKTIRVRGTLHEYGGKAGRKGKPEVIVDSASQITIVDTREVQRPTTGKSK